MVARKSVEILPLGCAMLGLAAIEEEKLSLLGENASVGEKLSMSRE